MPEYRISFEVKRPDQLNPPTALLERGHYLVAMDERLGVTVSGNRDGLLYLAELLVRCAISGYYPGFHVHEPLDSSMAGPNIDSRPELTIYGAAEEP